MQPPVEFLIHANIKAGPGILRQLSLLVCKELGFRRIGFVIDGNVHDRSVNVGVMIEECKRRADHVATYLYRESFEPTYALLENVKHLFSDEAQGEGCIDAFVGIGGGSAIDLAKGLAVLMTNSGPALSYRGFPRLLHKPLPVIAIPTTAGTGSEVTYNAVFFDASEKKKLGINAKENYPVLALLDPELVTLAPRSVVVSAGVDALVHTLESFASVKATLLTRQLSAAAYRIIMSALPRVAENSEDLAACMNMQWAAALAMIALSNSSSGPIGALSYYLGANYHVPHGIAGGVFVREIIQANHDLGYYGYGDLNEGASAQAARRNSEAVVKDVGDLLDRLGVASSLNDFGVAQEDVDAFCGYAQANFKGAFALNPVSIDDARVRAMLERMTA